jgi:hypothetical protein
MVWYITVLKVLIELPVPVCCGTLQILKFDTIIYACMVWHITVYSLKKIIKNCTGTYNCIQTLKFVMCYTIQAQIIVSNFINCNVPHHTGTYNCIQTLKFVMCYTIQAQIIVSNFINCNVPHHTGTTNSIKL